MRISDWSSDVCSSDLLITITTDLVEAQIDTAGGEIRHLALLKHEADGENASGPVVLFNTNTPHTYLGQTGLTGGVYPTHKSKYVAKPGVRTLGEKTGRASCRGRVCQYV